MKKIIILMLFIFNFGHSQTKEETIDWLNLKLKENKDRLNGECSIKIQNEKDWGEVIIIDINDGYFGHKNDIYSFLPKNISSVITTKKFRTDEKLGLIVFAKGDNIFLNGKDFVNKIDVFCGEASNETVIRMQKAIIHLLNLMGNPIKVQKELFTD